MDIALEQVEYRYQPNTPFERLALHNISLNIPSGRYLAVIGHTGSGKSTLLQHLNALLQPTKGQISIGDRTIQAGTKEKNLKEIRQKVGIVFQFPEHQLFEETVEKDICFGPMNFGVPQEEAIKRAKELVDLVGLPKGVLEKSPFDLSGGQMRRVAIAGVLAMDPDVLVLDEPTAGLDPRGRHEMMEMFYELHRAKQLSTILVTHSMEDAAAYADELVILHHGEMKRKGPPREIFSHPEDLESWGLSVPHIVRFQSLLEKKINHKLGRTCLTTEELAGELQAYMNRGGGN
ncbi:energy-coupling factor ABC transporter ATP-binding protein [Heyndrickxia acidiproducens]|uniref:energy-coupling factor ABC transporter ATP-binding protein n=1 Tax=Heyndrickxia acidiproducens TaxID=1121084 RepID=UPI000376462D|nr:energy-coupling factor ABC transporter ATP-binding protein [Heyndrickxia acidiproducens]